LELLPERLRLSPPTKFGEIGWIVDRRLVNADVCYYLTELAIMHENDVFEFLDQRNKEGRVNILEIGGGYGGLAYYLIRLYPNSEYVIVDIPESLLFSAIYLSVICDKALCRLIGDPNEKVSLNGKPAVTFLPDYAIDNLIEEGKFDLVINTFSLTEMSRAQAIHYAARVEKLLRPAGLFYEHNVPTYEGSEIDDLESLIKRSSSMRCRKCSTRRMKASNSRIASRIWTR
jgi:putative sugar O-methyltransferase